MRWKVLGLGLITFGSLLYALWGTDFAAAWVALAGFHVAMLGPIAVVYAVILLSRTLRFWFLLDARIRYPDLLKVMAIGFLAINVVPLRMGEFVRPYLLDDGFGVPFGSGLAAVVLERLLDMLALLVLLFAVGFVIDVPSTGVVIGGIDLLTAGRRAMGTGVVGGMLGVSLLAIAGPPGVAFLERFAARWVPPLAPVISRLGGRFVGGFRSLAARPKDAFGAVFATTMVWSSSTFGCYLVMKGFDGLPATFGVTVLNWSMTVAAMALLPTPGFVGSWEAGSVASLALVGADADLARAYSLFHHALAFGWTVSMGIIALLVTGRSLGQIVRDSRATSAAAPVISREHP